MVFAKTLLGKVFISHASTDKPFVRRLVSRLQMEGFQVWLDEHELHVGDQLAEEISKALSSSQVVLVVVSKASIKSRWLKFELNKATTLLCRDRFPARYPIGASLRNQLELSYFLEKLGFTANGKL
jgi:TIR domain